MSDAADLGDLKDLSDILAGLEELEASIVKLFAASPPPPTKLIDQKISLLADAVELLPGFDYPDLKNRWSDTVAFLTQKLHTVTNLLSSKNNCTDNNSPYKSSDYCASNVGNFGRTSSFSPLVEEVSFSDEVKQSNIQHTDNYIQREVVFLFAYLFINSSYLQFVIPNGQTELSLLTSSESKLFDLESSILKLLSIYPPPLIDLNEKISRFMELMSVIPSELSEKWNKKMEMLLKKCSVIPEGVLVKLNDDDGSTIKNGEFDKSRQPFLDNLLQQMTSIEANIEKSFTNQNLTPKLEKELEHEISTWMNFVDQIPMQHSDIIDYWSSKIAKLMEKFVCFSKSGNGGDCPVISSNTDLDSLKQNLNFYESIIQMSFSQNPKMLEPMEENLLNLQEDIRKIPAQYLDLINEWKNKFSDLWDRFAIVSCRFWLDVNLRIILYSSNHNSRKLPRRIKYL